MERIAYSAMFLRKICVPALHYTAKLRVGQHVWRKMKELGLTVKPTCRDCRAGRLLRKPIPVILGNRYLAAGPTKNSTIFQVRSNLLSIQASAVYHDTSYRRACQLQR